MIQDGKADLVLPDDRTCPDCGHRFFNARTLRRHRLIHSKETPFGCFYCSYATNRKDALMTHCVSQHEMDPDEFKAKAKQHFASQPRGRKRMKKEVEGDVVVAVVEEPQGQEEQQPEEQDQS